MPQAKSGRQTARGIVVKTGAVLLIERWRTDESGNKLHYFSVPGGQIEPGETAEEAVVRELLEETSVVVKPNRIVAKQYLEDGSLNIYFICDYLSGTAKLHPALPEVQLESNRSLPRWVSIGDNVALKDVYRPVGDLIEAISAGDIPDMPLTIK